MIQSFQITNYLGEELYLDIRKPEDTGFLITSVTGLNYPETEFAQQNYSNYDGAHFGNSHVSVRNIVMNILFYQWNKENLSIEDLRWKLQRYFLPKSDLTFFATNEHGTFRINGYVETCEINIFTKREMAEISILCPDPYFIKESTDNNVRIGLVEEMFHFPVSIEGTKPIDTSNYSIVRNGFGGYDFVSRTGYEEIVNAGTKHVKINGTPYDNKYNGMKIVATHNNKSLEFGRIKKYPSTIIDYPGSAITGLTLHIETKGKVEGLRINNNTRGEFIAIDDAKLFNIVGTRIQEKDQILINTTKGEKHAVLIRDAKSYNILNACLPVKKWPQLQTGINEFTYSTTTDIVNVDIRASYNIKMLGI